MKRLLIMLVIALTCSLVFDPNPTYAEEVNHYAPYKNADELSAAYAQAIKDGDVNQQQKLVAIADRALDEIIEESKSSLAEIPVPAANMDEQYWLGQFPVLFHSGQWVQRSDGITLSLNPKDTVRHGLYPVMQNGWNALYTKFRKDSYWANTTSMERQYHCHYTMAKDKARWNIEPWKTSINPFSCN